MNTCKYVILNEITQVLIITMSMCCKKRTLSIMVLWSLLKDKDRFLDFNYSTNVAAVI